MQLFIAQADPQLRKCSSNSYHAGCAPKAYSSAAQMAAYSGRYFPSRKTAINFFFREKRDRKEIQGRPGNRDPLECRWVTYLSSSLSFLLAYLHVFSNSYAYQSFNLPVSTSAYFSNCLPSPLPLSVSLFNLFVCLYICLRIHLSIHPFIHP